VTQKEIIAGFVKLGVVMRAIANQRDYDKECGVSEEQYVRLFELVNHQIHLNGWFTKHFVLFSLREYGKMLQKEELEKFATKYSFATSPKKIAVIMAGNIPLVGFHDFMSVLLSGHSIIAKLSSDDARLLPELVGILTTFDDRFSERITLTTGFVKNMDAVIATGSDNSLKFFEEYFGKYPHIFRRNRTGVAILDGTETKEQMEALGLDIFCYFGLGCRNVSHLIVPQDYDFKTFFEGIFKFGDLINHNKYGNNYDYNRAVYLLNQISIIDNNFVLLKETEDLHASLAMVNFHRYSQLSEVENYLKAHEQAIQVVVGKNHTPFGCAQTPKIDEFADHVDTMRFLENV